MRGVKTRKTFLIIDDDRVFSNSVGEYLSGDNVEVLIANTAAEGINLCRQTTIDVVLLDQRLPHFNYCPNTINISGNPFTAAVFLRNHSPISL